MTNERFTVDRSQLVERVKQLIHQGNIRRVRILHKGRVLLDIPLTIGVPVSAVAILAAPALAALGAIAAMATECTIEVERVKEDVKKKTEADEEK